MVDEQDNGISPHDDPVENTKKAQLVNSVKNSKVVTRNKKLAYVIASTHNVGFLTPIWVIFGTDKLGLSLLLSLILGSTGWVTSSLFEVPMGAFADKYGRKLSLVCGLSFAAIGDLSLAIFENFSLLMAFQVLAGVGFALLSGSLEGLLHDSFEAAGEHAQYSKVSSRMLFLLNASRVATVPLGVWLYNLDPKTSYTFPYIASVFAFSISIISAALLVEKRSSQQKLDELDSTSLVELTGRIWNQMGVTFKEMLANQDIKRVVILLGLYAFIGEGNWALYQVYFREREIGLTETGWVYTILVLLMALGSLFVTKIYRSINVMWALNLIIALVAFNIVLMHFALPIASIAFLINAFIAPMSFYLQDNAIQNRISGDNKTTALSISSMVYNIGAMLGVYGLGALAQAIGVLNSQWYLVAYGTIVVVAMGAWCFKDGFGVRPEDARATGLAAPFDDASQLKP